VSRRARQVRGLALLVVLSGVIAVGLAILLGGGDKQPLALGGAGAPTTLQPSRPRGVVPPARPAPGFTPPPAVVRMLAAMPLERQVAQLFMVGLQGSSSPGAVTLAGPGWGGFVFSQQNYVSDFAAGAYAAAASTADRLLRAPAALVAATQEGGPQTAIADLPPEGQAVLGSSGQPDAARAQATLAAQRLLAMGFNTTLAPLADVDTAGGPLNGRLFSTSPGLVARFTAAAVGGYRAAGIISIVGHFPGTGAASADPDQMQATVGGSLPALKSRDLLPFAAVAGAAPVIEMSNAVYAAFDGVTPAGLLPDAIDLLRRGYGFEGVVISDDLDAALQATGGTIGQAALAALQAGDDLLYITGTSDEQLAAYNAVLSAAQRNAGVRSRVRHAAERVLALKLRYKLVSSSG